jgi:hypothetical protein
MKAVDQPPSPHPQVRARRDGRKRSRGYLRKVVEKASHALTRYAELLGRLPLSRRSTSSRPAQGQRREVLDLGVPRRTYVLFKIDKTAAPRFCGCARRGIQWGARLRLLLRLPQYMTDFNITVQFCIAI